MGDVVVGSGEIDCWREVVPVQHEDRQLTVEVLFRTLKYSTAAKEYHVKLTSEEDDCFLYRTVITPEEHRRLMLSHTMSISFDQLPEYFRQLLKSVQHEGEYGERYFINVLAQSTPGLAARIELLITMRQAGYVVQNKRLCLPFTLASDADFKEHLMACFDKIKKEKEQLRRTVTQLEHQLREERQRNRELEDKNRWLQNELEFSQGLLRSAEKIQKHYESLLNQKHRGEIGGSVLVKIEDSSIDGETGIASRHVSDPLPSFERRATADESEIGRNVDGEPDPKRCRSISMVEVNRVVAISATGDKSDQGSNRISAIQCTSNSDNLTVSTNGTSTTTTIQAPVITCVAGDKKQLKGAAKRKASFHNYTYNQSGNTNVTSAGPITTMPTPSDTETTANSTTAGMETSKTTEQPQRRPPPRKFAAAMVQVDSQLIQIRREQEQQKRKTEDEEEGEVEESTANSSTDNISTVNTTSPVQRVEDNVNVEKQEPNRASPIDTMEESEQDQSQMSPVTSIIPTRPLSHPTVLVSPQSSHQQSFLAPDPPPPPPLAVPQPAPVVSHQMPGHFQSSWQHIMSTSPVMSNLQLPVAAAAAAAFSGHHDFVGVGVGMSPYLLPTINSVSGGVVTPLAPTTVPVSDGINGTFEDYTSADTYGRALVETADVLNERLRAEMGGGLGRWGMAPKSEPGDYQESREMSNGVITSYRAETNPTTVSTLMMGRPQLMSALTMNENSMGSTSDSPAPSAAVPSSYSGSASPSVSSSSADGVEGVISYLKCLICERSFGQEGAAAHMAQHITDPQRCTICTEMPPFPSKDELIKHMVGHCARAYACRYCGKENPRVHYLKIHVRSHTGEKPYTCMQCGRGFADASTWRRHERVHTGEKPYECTICGRRIARRDNVKIHMRSHMRSKVQMSCRTCGKVFSQPNHLVLHERMCGGAAGGIGSSMDMKPGLASSASAGDLRIVD